MALYMDEMIQIFVLACPSQFMSVCPSSHAKYSCLVFLVLCCEGNIFIDQAKNKINVKRAV